MDAYRQLPALLACCCMFLAIILSAPTISNSGLDEPAAPYTTTLLDTNVATAETITTPEDLAETVAALEKTEKEAAIATLGSIPIATTSAPVPTEAPVATNAIETVAYDATTEQVDRRRRAADSHTETLETEEAAVITEESATTAASVETEGPLATDAAAAAVISAESNFTNDIISAITNVTNQVISAQSDIANSVISAVTNLTDQFELSFNNSISESKLGEGVTVSFGDTETFFTEQAVRRRRAADLSTATPDETSLPVETEDATTTLPAVVAQLINQTNDIIAAETNLTDSIINAENNLTNSIVSAETNLTDSIISAETNLTNSIISAETNLTDSIISAENNLTKSIISAESNFTNSIISAENNLTNSFISAISNITSELELSINNTISNTLDIFNGSNQISSIFSQTLNVNSSQNQFSSLFSQTLEIDSSQSQIQPFSGSFDNCVFTPNDPDCQNRDGGWGQWSSFSACSPLCEQSRHRACDSPKPLGNGTMCKGEFLERRSCEADKCKPLPPPTDDMGCYHIGQKYYHSGDAHNTRTECRQKCAADDKLFSGVHAVECFCSNVASDGDNLYKVTDTLCTTPCPGNSSETCGGEDTEKEVSVSSFTRTDTNNVGCYDVTDYSSEFAIKIHESVKDKSNHCATTCSDRRFRYSMTNKTHCACVNNLNGAAKKTAESDCDDEDKKDTGSSGPSSISDIFGGLFGGGVNDAKRVKRTSFELHSVRSGTDLGCYKATLLDKQIRIDTEDAESAVNDCIRACNDHGFPLAAAQNLQSDQFVCQCGRGITQDVEKASHCDSFCGKYRCGSDNFESYFSAKCGESFLLGSSITPFNTNASTDLYNRTGSRITWVTSFSAPSNALPSSIGEPLDVDRTALSFEVDLNSPRLVRQLQFSGHAREPVGVTRFVMAVTVDGSAWSFVKVPGTNTHQEFTASSYSSDLNSIATFDFPHLIAVKSARVYVLDFETFPAFRMDFIGCNANI